jgi:hypothetical protein
VREAVEKGGAEEEGVGKVGGEIRECFEILVPRFQAPEPRADDDDDDDDDVAWEEGDAPPEVRAATDAQRRHEARARQLVDAMVLPESLRLDLGSGGGGGEEPLRLGMLSGTGGGARTPEDRRREDPLDALGETLAASLASLRRHRSPRIERWTAAINEHLAAAERDPGAAFAPGRGPNPGEIAAALRKLVRLKSDVAEVLGKAERYGRLKGGGGEGGGGRAGEAEAAVDTPEVDSENTSKRGLDVKSAGSSGFI